MRMFATMIASVPPLLYWRPESLEILHILEELRESGTGVWETMDAGPQVKLICLESECSAVLEAFRDLPVTPVILKAGNGPEVVE